MNDTLMMTSRTLEHPRLLLDPTSSRQRYLGVTGPRQHDLGDRRKEDLQPLTRRHSIYQLIHHVVIDEEEAAGATRLGQHAARTTAREERLGKGLAILRDHQLKRRIIEGRVRIVGLTTKIAKRIIEPVFNNRETTGIEFTRLVQIEHR